MKIKNVFPMPILSQRVIPAVSTWNLGVFMTMTVILKNIFLSFVEHVIIIFMIYGVFVGICLFLFLKIFATALVIGRLDYYYSLFLILPLRMFKIAYSKDCD